MAVTLFQRKIPRIGGPILPPIVLFDASIREGHLIENEITVEPVEDQGFRTDGVVTRPRPITLVGVVSSANPVSRGPPSPDIGVFAGIGQLGVFSSRLSNRIHLQAWKKVVEIVELKIPVDVVTTVERMSGMMPRRASVDRVKEDGTSLQIMVEFQKFRKSLVDDLSNLTEEVAALGGEVEDLGAQGFGEVIGAPG